MRPPRPNRLLRLSRDATLWHCAGGSPRRDAYVLLETVLATGLLLLGLAVIGTQVQDSQAAVYEMRQRLKAMQLAESQFGMLDLGLVELDSIDEVQEEEFGPRNVAFGWRLTIHETANEGLNLLELEILRYDREDEDEEFDFDEAETVYTRYAMRPTPRKLDLSAEFGLNEEEFEELAERLLALGVEGLSADEFDPSILARLDYEELIEVLPPLLDAFGVSLVDFTASLPPEVLEALRESGMLEGEGGEGEEGVEEGR